MSLVYFSSLHIRIVHRTKYGDFRTAPAPDIRNGRPGIRVVLRTPLRSRFESSLHLSISIVSSFDSSLDRMLS